MHAVRAHPVAGPVFRLFEHIIVSPSVRHTHHGYGRDGATYRNFRVTFAFLDYLFGTLHIPDGRPAHYGLPGSEPHWSEEVFHPLINLDRRTATEAAESV